MPLDHFVPVAQAHSGHGQSAGELYSHLLIVVAFRCRHYNSAAHDPNRSMRFRATATATNKQTGDWTSRFYLHNLTVLASHGHRLEFTGRGSHRRRTSGWGQTLVSLSDLRLASENILAQLRKRDEPRKPSTSITIQLALSQSAGRPFRLTLLPFAPPPPPGPGWLAG